MKAGSRWARLKQVGAKGADVDMQSKEEARLSQMWIRLPIAIPIAIAMKRMTALSLLRNSQSKTESPEGSEESRFAVEFCLWRGPQEKSILDRCAFEPTNG